MVISQEHEDNPGLRERKRVATRERISQRALELFEAKGYAATRVDEVCFDLSISKATFFRYFRSKDAILRAFAESLVAEALDRPAGYDSGNSPDSSVEGLRRICDQMERTGRARPQIVRALVESGAIDPVRDPSFGKVSDSPIAVLIRSGQASGEFSSSLSTALLALLFQAALYSVVGLWAAGVADEAPDFGVALLAVPRA
jgi:AcrR family transcriptional regulator